MTSKGKEEEKKEEDETILSWPGNCFCTHRQDSVRQSVYFWRASLIHSIPQWSPGRLQGWRDQEGLTGQRRRKGRSDVNTLPLLFDVLCYFVAEGARSFPPHAPNPPLNHSLMWRICDRGQSTCAGGRSLYSTPCFATGSLGDHMLVTTVWLNLAVLQLCASRLEIKLPLFHLCSALSTEVISYWHRDYSVYVQSTAGVLLALQDFITTAITQKEILKQGKEHLFPSRERKLFTTSVYWEGICLWTAAGAGAAQSWSLTLGVVMCRQLAGSCMSPSKK